MENFILFLRKTGLIKRFIPIITAISMLFSIMACIGPLPTPRDKIQNVIFIIGDGMGENHLKLAKQELGINLVMETIPLRGQSKTDSFGGAVTDSAAGATALACGVKTTNGCIGVYPYDTYALEGYPVNLIELAKGKGMETGIVTTDLTTGATPAGFSVHTSARANTADIALQEIGSGIDLFWGAADSETKQTAIESGGYKYISSLTEMNALNESEKSFGQFNGDDLWRASSDSKTPTLSQMTDKAIDLLDDEDGFFLMIESAHIDKFSHSNDIANAVDCVKELDKSIAIALDFAKEDGNTLVIVTADHETGAVELKDGKYVYTSVNHSGDNVPLFVYGSSNFIKNGQAIKNTDVSLYTAMSMGFTQKEFPRKVPVPLLNSAA
ncbi:MAG: alkaline phosphatase [Eubacteriales bacterium]